MKEIIESSGILYMSKWKFPKIISTTFTNRVSSKYTNYFTYFWPTSGNLKKRGEQKNPGAAGP
jgi:hypothetical protein